MDANMVALLIGTASKLGADSIKALGGRLRDKILGTPKERAILDCYRVATFAFAAVLAGEDDDKQGHFESVMEMFQKDPDVARELSRLIEWENVDKDDVIYSLKKAGLEEYSLGEADIHQALAVFEAAFFAAAIDKSELGSDIQVRIQNAQLQVQRDLLDEMKRFVSFVRQASLDSMQIQRNLISAVTEGSGSVKIEFRFNPVDPPDNMFETVYLKTLIHSCDPLDLGPIMEMRRADPNRQAVTLNISDVFTDLHVRRRTILAGWETESSLIKKDMEDRKIDRGVRAIDAIDGNPRLVILGRPGGGKSALVNYLAVQTAKWRQNLPEAGEKLADWLKEKKPLPVRIILRKFAEAIEPSETGELAGLVWEYIGTNLKNCGCEEFFPVMKKTLVEGGGLVFFDGLDEVGDEQVGKRKVLVDAIEQFSNQVAPSHVVVTCREYAYQADQSWRLPEAVFPVFQLETFNREQIKSFTEIWYRKTGPQMGWDDEKCVNEADLLFRAIDRLDHLRELAQYPLLMTLMASVHGVDGSIPNDRADLYERAVKLLLENWDNRIVREEAGRTTMEPGLIWRLRVQSKILRAALEEVAFIIHERQESNPHRSVREEGDIPREILRDTLKRELGSGDKADIVIEYIEKRAGLIQAKSENLYFFPHRTFQEFLAAAHILKRNDWVEILKDRVEKDIEWWREVCLLAAGISKTTTANVASLVNMLLYNLDVAKNQAGSRSEQYCLAAECLVETGFYDHVKREEIRGGGAFSDTYRKVEKWLLYAIQSDIAADRRETAGQSLSRMGDPRSEVMTLEDMQFCQVPGGAFWMGGEMYDDEKPFRRNNVCSSDFWLARFPVTNRQFSLFVESGAYSDVSLWKEAIDAGLWMDGQIKGRYDENPRKKPMDFGSPFNLDNHPVTGVTWYEAIAFTGWLDLKWRNAGILKDAWHVRLVSEAEWEKAARGGEEIPENPVILRIHEIGDPGVNGRMIKKKNPHTKREYPWGDAQSADNANYADTNIGSTNAVGCFPKGASPYGCEDMAGNVWEWTRSLRKEYPYKADDGREDPAAKGNRVIRGGSFGSNQWYVRCACRVADYPDGRNDDLGFRIVLSP
jgi:formylglycine-generating enzyme required for sulfatase activity